MSGGGYPEGLAQHVEATMRMMLSLLFRLHEENAAIKEGSLAATALVAVKFRPACVFPRITFP